MSEKLRELGGREEVGVRELAGWLAGGLGPVLLDCREDEEFAFNRIEGARHLALSRFGEGMAALVEEGAPLVVYCHHGVRSLSAARALRALGHPAVASLAGGIEAWAVEVDAGVGRY
jgi:rhodanese-related sulfurtransferase